MNDYEIINNLENHGDEKVLPGHFLRATFPRIGGRILTEGGGNLVGLGLPVLEGGMVIRGHKIGESDVWPKGWLDVESKAEFIEEIVAIDGGLTISRPNEVQAREARQLQRKTWGDGSALYPWDLYGKGRGAETGLVALENRKIVGFLLGFGGRGKKWIGDISGGKEEGEWIESQLMAVDPESRGKGISKALKWRQYEDAENRGIRMIHWTVDPLQIVNARLNYGLGAVAAEHVRKYYSFVNKLNQVPASRFGIYWPVGSERAERIRGGERILHVFKKLLREGARVINPLSDNWENIKPDGEKLLIEIPINWTEMQENNVRLAERWRERTDLLFDGIIGTGSEKYVIGGGVVEEERAYLIAVPFGEIF